jgi:hypothetical protein
MELSTRPRVASRAYSTSTLTWSSQRCPTSHVYAAPPIHWNRLSRPFEETSRNAPSPWISSFLKVVEKSKPGTWTRVKTGVRTRHAGAVDIDGARAIDGRGVEAVVVAEAEVPAAQGRAEAGAVLHRADVVRRQLARLGHAREAARRRGRPPADADLC